MIALCTHCHAKLRVEDTLAGQERECPACHKTFKLPAAPPPLPQTPPEADSGSQVAKAPAPTAAPSTPADKPAGQPAPGAPQARPAQVMGASARAAFDRALGSLHQALSLPKLAFYFVGLATLLLVCELFLWLAGALGATVFAIALLVVMVALMGFAGVFAGGVARMAHLEAQGQNMKFGDGLQFAKRRFLSLFGAALLLAAVGGLVFVITNGLVAALNQNDTVGSFLGALLFLPQAAINLVLVLTAALWVLLPCAIAMEDTGVFRALSRVLSCIRRRTRELAGHFVATLFLLVVVSLVLTTIVGAATLPTYLINGPTLLGPMLDDLNSSLSSSLQAEFPSEFAELGLGRSGSVTPAGNGIRRFFTWLIWLGLGTYPTVYWIVSFVAFYRSPQPGEGEASAVATAGGRAGIGHG